MSFKAKTIMTRHFVFVEPDASIDQAMALLLRHRISGMPVVDEDGCLQGIITEFDLLKLLYEANECVKVSDLQTRDVITVDENDPLPEVAELFLSTSIRRVPVMSGDRVVGIISRRDLVRYIHSLHQAVAQQLEARREAHAASTTTS